jgi:dTDP-4-amino-4,6-dideoxygalactose transaminase
MPFCQYLIYKGLELSHAGKMPVAEKVAEQVICLPIYTNLDEDIIEFI